MMIIGFPLRIIFALWDLKRYFDALNIPKGMIRWKLIFVAAVLISYIVARLAEYLLYLY